MFLLGIILPGAFGAQITVTTTLQAAINSASSGDTILIPAGTYTTGSLAVMKKLTFVGDGCGSTVIEGTGSDIFVVSSTTATFERLTLTTSGSSRGIDATGSDLQVRKSCFEDLGSSQIDGGGIRAVGGAVEIVDSRFANNEGKRGGAIATSSAPLVVLDSTFDANVSEFHGGAIYAAHDVVKVQQSTFTSQVAKGSGGAIWLNSAIAPGDYSEISYTSFDDNSSVGDGGALWLAHTPLVVSRTTFGANSAGLSGGAISSHPFADHLKISNSAFSGNSASHKGGAVIMNAQLGNRPTLTIIASDFSWNLAGAEGGAVHFDDLGTVDLRLNTYVENVLSQSSGTSGGAIRGSNSESIEIRNSFFCGNHAATGSVYSSVNTTVDEQWDNNIAIENPATLRGAVHMGDGGNSTTYEIRNSTFLDNQAPQSTGFYLVSSGSGTWTIDDSIFADSGSGPALVSPTTISASAQGNLFFNTTPYGGFFPVGTGVTVDPMLFQNRGVCTGYTTTALTSAISGVGADPALVPLP